MLSSGPKRAEQTAKGPKAQRAGCRLLLVKEHVRKFRDRKIYELEDILYSSRRTAISKQT